MIDLQYWNFHRHRAASVIHLNYAVSWSVNLFIYHYFSALPSFLVRNSRTTSISPNGILVFPKMVVGPRGDHYQEGACLAESVTNPPLTDVENHVVEVLFRISVLFRTSECKPHPSLQIFFKDLLSDDMMTLETCRKNFIYHNKCAIIYKTFAQKKKNPRRILPIFYVFFHGINFYYKSVII